MKVRVIDEFQGICKVGGACMIFAGTMTIGYLLLGFTILSSLLPSSPEAGLTAVKSQGPLFGIFWGLLASSDFLFVPAYLALYIVLRKLDYAWSLIAGILGILGIAINVSADAVPHLAILALSNGYSLTSTDAQRTALSAAAESLRLMGNGGGLVASAPLSIAILISAPLCSKVSSAGS